MDGMNACAVEDLLAAGSTWGRDDAWRDIISVGYGFTDGGKQHHFADGQRSSVMFFFVAERTSHATTTAWNDMYFGSSEQFEGLYCLLRSHQSFLVAMTMEPNLQGISFEIVGGDVTSGDFSHDKLIKQQGIVA